MAPHALVKQLRLHAIEISGEFVGTFLFLVMALSAAQVANSDTSHASDDVHPGDINLTQLLYISLAFGFSLAVNVSIFARVSGGLFNPAVRETFYCPVPKVLLPLVFTRRPLQFPLLLTLLC